MLYKLTKVFKTLKKDDGWTFIEVMIGVGIVMMLTAGVGIVAMKQYDGAKVTAAKSQIGSFVLALEIYRQDCDRYPTNEQGLEALWEKPVLSPVSENWNGAYIGKKLPLDPWKREYIYKVPGENGLPYTITSLGADGVPGGEGTDKDIHSYE